jgi:hypothetical protein
MSCSEPSAGYGQKGGTRAVRKSRLSVCRMLLNGLQNLQPLYYVLHNSIASTFPTFTGMHPLAPPIAEES